MKNVGPIIRTTRERQGIRATDLAFYMGKDPAYLSKLERDLIKETPPPEVLAALERHLGIPQVVLLRAIGYAIPDGPRPTYADNRQQMIADNWDQLNDSEKNALMLIIEGNRRRRGLDGLDDVVQIVASSGPLQASG